MGCCRNDFSPPRIPRRNGFSWPLHPNQLIYWTVLIAYEVLYNGVLVPSLKKQYQIPAYIMLNVAFGIHLVTHVRVLIINPANPDLIKNWPDVQPELDKTVHRHVIENNHCNICQIAVPDGGKHCGKCNKCVADFDHHCTWLNTCIGGRNYIAFLACVSTTVAWCTTIVTVSVVLMVMYFVNKSWLTPSRELFAFNTSDIVDRQLGNWNLSSSVERNETGRPLLSDHSLVVFVPVKDDVWLATVIVSAALAGYIDGLVIYLLGFHVYLICTGQSTYHVTRKDQLIVRPKLEGPLKRSLYRSCLSKRGKMRCRVTDMRRNCAKEDAAARLDVEASIEEATEDSAAAAAPERIDGVSNKNVDGATVICNTPDDVDNVLPSQTQLA